MLGRWRVLTSFGLLAAAGTVLSLVVCYATRIRFWIPDLDPLVARWVNPHVQAAVIVGAAGITVVGLAADVRRHQSRAPLVAGLAGLLMLAWSMYGPFGRFSDIAAFVVLAAAVFLNQNQGLRHLSAQLRAQAGEIARKNEALERQARELEEWNRSLHQRVQEQVASIERLGRLKRFFSPHLADLILTGGADDPLKTHRREITVVFLDLRGFTAFADRAEPEEVMRVLGEYHAEMGKLIALYEGTLERFTGDGIMIFFNDPLPVPNPVERAVRMAVAMRDRVDDLGDIWQRRGHQLALGVGIAQGYATIGAIGFEGRSDYAAIGRVTNLAARLCAEARTGQILTNRITLSQIDGLVEAEPLGEIALKGVAQPIPVFNIMKLAA